MVLTTLTAAFAFAIVQGRFMSGDIQMTVGIWDDARGPEIPQLANHALMQPQFQLGFSTRLLFKSSTGSTRPFFVF